MDNVLNIADACHTIKVQPQSLAYENVMDLCDKLLITQCLIKRSWFNKAAAAACNVFYTSLSLAKLLIHSISSRQSFRRCTRTSFCNFFPMLICDFNRKFLFVPVANFVLIIHLATLTVATSFIVVFVFYYSQKRFYE